MAQANLPRHTGNNIQSQNSDNGDDSEIYESKPDQVVCPAKDMGQYDHECQEDSQNNPLLCATD